MKKILLITRGFPYGNSEESFIQTEFKTLAEHFDITVFSEGTEPLPIQKGFENTKTIRFDDLTLNKMAAKAVLRKDTLKDMASAVKGAGAGLAGRRIREITGYSARACYIEKALRKAIEKTDPDIIYTYWCTPATLAALRLKKEFPSIKIVSRFHGYDLFNERRPSMRQPFKEQMAGELDALFFSCGYGRDYFEKNWGRKGSVHYLGTKKRDALEEDPDSFVIVSCSNLIPLKRVDLIVSAVSGLPDDIKVRWHHFGDGPCRESLKKQAEAELGSKKNVEYSFEGFVENEKLIESYSALRPWVFITASGSEGGVPVSMQEAISLGIPCIGTAVGGVPEIITDGHDGFLLQPEPDSREISAALERYYRLSEEERKAFRKHACEKWADSFDAESNAAAFSQELLDLPLN